MVACVVGALLAIPGPFDLVALGRLARSGSGWMQTNKFAAVAAIAGVFGIALIGRGISGLG